MATQNEVVERISKAWNKKELNGFIYFVDMQPRRELLHRARPDGSEVLKISRETCKSFEVKDGLIHTVEEYSERDDAGYSFDRYRDHVTYEIANGEAVQVSRTRGYLSSSD